jgi:hypothetical protein
LNTTVIVEVLPNTIKYKISIKIEIKELNMEPISSNNSSSATMIIRQSLAIVQSASPIPAQTNLNSLFSQYDRNKVTSSGGSFRRSALNYENDSVSQNLN